MNLLGAVHADSGAYKGGQLDPDRLAKHYINESQKILQSAQISLN
jgi:hypothetical protein